MKKILYLCLLCISLSIEGRQIVINDSAAFVNWTTTLSGDTIKVNCSMTFSRKLPIPAKTNNWAFIQNLHYRLKYTGTGSPFDLTRDTNFFICANIEANPGALCLIKAYYCAKGTIQSKCTNAKWGIRLFYCYDMKILNTIVQNTWDDNIYTEDTRNVEVAYSMLDNANSGYAVGSTSGGDNLQIAKKQGFINVHHNIMIKYENGDKFNFVAGQDTRDINDSVIYYDNVFIARSWQQTAMETAPKKGSSNVYFKSDNCRGWNNTYKGGSNAVATQVGTGRLRLSNEMFDGQAECIVSNLGWNIVLNNCTFTNVKEVYFKTKTSVTASKCVFNGTALLSIDVVPVLNNCLINPVKVPMGFGYTSEYTNLAQLKELEVMYQQLSKYNHVLDSLNTVYLIQLAQDNIKQYYLADSIQHLLSFINSDTLTIKTDTCLYDLFGGGLEVKVNKLSDRAKVVLNDGVHRIYVNKLGNELELWIYNDKKGYRYTFPLDFQ